MRIVAIVGLMLTTLGWALTHGWTAESTALLLLAQVFILASGRAAIGTVLVVGITAYLFYQQYLAGSVEDALEFCYPVHSPNEWAVAQGFLDSDGPEPSMNFRHLGEDWTRSAGSEVLAVADGRVIAASDAGPGWGHVVMIKHAEDVSLYAHLGAAGLPSVGASVQRGDPIGRVGATSENGSTATNLIGPHFHWEIRTQGAVEAALANGDYAAGRLLNAAEPESFTGDGYWGPRPKEPLTTPPEVTGWVSPSDWLSRRHSARTNRSSAFSQLALLLVILVGFFVMFSGPFTARRNGGVA